MLLERGAIILDEWKAHWSNCSACGEKERPLFMKLQGGMCGKCAPFIYVFRTGVFVLIAGVGGFGLIKLMDNAFGMIMPGVESHYGRAMFAMGLVMFALIGLLGLYYTIWSFSRIGKTSKQGSNRYMLENKESESAYMLENIESEIASNFGDRIVAAHLYGAAAGFMLGGVLFVGQQVYVYLESGEWRAWSLRHLFEKVWPWLNNSEDWLGWHKIAYVFLDLMPVSVTFFLIGWIVKSFARAKWEGR